MNLSLKNIATANGLNVRFGKIMNFNYTDIYMAKKTIEFKNETGSTKYFQMIWKGVPILVGLNVHNDTLDFVVNGGVIEDNGVLDMAYEESEDDEELEENDDVLEIRKIISEHISYTKKMLDKKKLEKMRKLLDKY